MKIYFYYTYLIKIIALISQPCRQLETSPVYNENILPTEKLYNRLNKTNYVRKGVTNICPCVLLLILSLSFTPFAFATVTGPGAGWLFCRKITLNAATPLADFQVKVTLTTGQYINMNANGNDLRFYDINNNACNYWIETWNTGGTSTLWVKVVTSGAVAVYMYYGNAAAPAASNGAGVFDFFDDFTTAPGAAWSTVTSGGSVTQSGTNVTLSNTNGGSVNLSNTNAFTTSSASFIVETKHQEGAYNRNRFYATTGTFGGSPTGFDYGYFTSSGTSANAQVFWNAFPGATSVTAGTNYLTQWQITDGSTYNWFTYNYASGVAVTNGSRTTTFGSPVRFISISVTEASATSSIIDWVRVRKASAAFTQVTGTAGNAVSNIATSITGQTNVLCNGKSTGAATVTATGGGTPYTYSWNSAPIQTTQTATGLPAGTYIATVTESTIGISATATATLTEPVPVTASATQTNISCFNAGDGQIQVTGSNGITPYTFSINNGSAYQSSNTFINLSPGAYKPRVKDNNGCESKSIQ